MPLLLRSIIAAEILESHLKPDQGFKLLSIQKVLRAMTMAFLLYAGNHVPVNTRRPPDVR